MQEKKRKTKKQPISHGFLCIVQPFNLIHIAPLYSCSPNYLCVRAANFAKLIPTSKENKYECGSTQPNAVNTHLW